MSGNATVGAATADVDMSFGDILDNLEMGFMGAYRATRGQYSVTVDGIYMGLGAGRRERASRVVVAGVVNTRLLAWIRKAAKGRQLLFAA
jgi:hypothetical protein